MKISGEVIICTQKIQHSNGALCRRYLALKNAFFATKRISKKRGSIYDANKF